MIKKILKKLLPQNLTWWKLVIMQLSGLALVILMIKLGIDKPFASIVGHKNDDSLGWIIIFSVVLPIVIGWYKRIKGWWVLALFWTCLLLIMICCFVVKIYPLNSIEQPIETLQEEPIVFVPVTLESDSYLMPEEESLGYINSVKGHDEKQIIYDSFIEGRMDTLYIEEDNVEFTFNVVSSSPNIPVLKLENTICPSLVNEGDFDGNGTTEIGILDTWHTSSYRLYRIYTLKNDKWYYLLPPLVTSESVMASGVELAEPTGERDKVRVRYADFEAPLSSCASSPIKETIVVTSFLSIRE